jgi:hypothetical protein
MGKKRYRPLTKGEDKFKDLEEQQSIENRDAIAQNPGNFFQEKSRQDADDPSSLNLNSPNDYLLVQDRLGHARARQGIDAGMMGQPDGLSASSNNTLVHDKASNQGDGYRARQAWNEVRSIFGYDPIEGAANRSYDYDVGWGQHWMQLQKQVDVLQGERYQGYKLLAENEIQTIVSNAKQEYEANLRASAELTEDEQERIEDLQEEITENEEDYAQNKKEISEQAKYIGKVFDLQTKLGEKQEGKFMAGELFKDIGGSMSDLKSMAAMVGTSYAMSQAYAASSSAIAGGIGSVGGPIGSGAAAGLTWLVTTLGGTIAGLFIQQGMRENESAAEAFGAFEEKKQRLREFELYKNDGAPLTEQQEMAIDQQARLGVKTLYDQQNNLFAYDMLNTVIHALPWTRALGWADEAARYGFGAVKVGGKTVNKLTRGSLFMGINAIGEGAEEGDQYQINQDYQANKFTDDDYGYRFLGLKWRDMGDNIVTRAKSLHSMGGMLVGRHVGGQTDTPEFRNSVRSGMMLGGLMGLGYSGISRGVERAGRARKAAANEAMYSQYSGFFGDYLDAEQARSRAGMYQDVLDSDNKRKYSFGKMMRELANKDGIYADKLKEAGVDPEKLWKEWSTHKALNAKLNSKEYSNLNAQEKRNLLVQDAAQRRIIAQQLDQQSKAKTKLTETISQIENNEKGTLVEGLERLARVAALKMNIGNLEKFEMEKDGNPAYTNHVKNNLLNTYKAKLKKAEQDLNDYLKGEDSVSLSELEQHEKSQELTDLNGLIEEKGTTSAIMSLDRQAVFNKDNAGQIKTHPFFAEAQHVGRNDGLRRKKQQKLQDEWNNSELDSTPLKDGDTVWTTDGSSKGKLKLNEDGSGVFEDGHVSIELSAEDIANGAVVKRISKEEKADNVKENMNSGSEVGRNTTNTVEETNEDKEKSENVKQETNTTETTDKTDPVDFMEKPNVRVYNYSTREVLDYEDALALNRWIHTKTDAEIKGTRIKYVIDLENLDGNTKLTAAQKKAIKEGKPFPKSKYTDIGSLPVKMLILDSDGNIVLDAGVPVGSYLGDTKGTKLARLRGESEAAYKKRALQFKNKNNNMRLLKSRIYEAYQNGNTNIIGSIDSVGFGEINVNPGNQFSVSTLGGNLILGIGTGGVIVDNEGNPLQEGPMTNIGRIYGLVKTINGYLFPVKLNQRNINQEEANQLWDIVRQLLQSTKENPFTITTKLPGGLTVGQFLALMVYEMSPQDGNKHGMNSVFSFDLEKPGNPVFRVGDMAFTRDSVDSNNESDTKAKFIEHILNNKKRRVHKEGLGKSLFDLPFLKNISTFSFMGQIYIKGDNDSYLNFLQNNGSTIIDEHVVTTDAALTPAGDIVRNRELGLSTNIETTPPDSKTPATPKTSSAVQKIIDKLKKTKDIFKLSPDNSGYINTLTKKIYSRVTSFINQGNTDKVLQMSNDIEQNNGYILTWNSKKEEWEVTVSKEMIDKHKPTTPQLNQLLFLKTSTIVGNNVDMMVRDYFNSGIKTYAEYVAQATEGQPFMMHDPRSFDKFVISLDKLAAKFAANGEIVIANETMDDFEVVLHNDDLGIAGTVDLMTVDQDGKVRIYDMKTIRNMRSIDTQYQGAPSKRIKWGKQLSLYRILLNNTYGILAEDVKVIPINVSYEKGNPTFTPTLELTFISVPIVDKVRSAEIKQAENQKEKPKVERPLPDNKEDTDTNKQEEDGPKIIQVKPTAEQEQDKGKKKKRKKYNRNRKGKYGGQNLPMQAPKENSEENVTNKEKTIAYFDKLFGKGVIPVEIVDGLIALGEKGSFAYGIFHNAMVSLSNMAPIGAKYHEAWHVAEEMYLTENQRDALNKETSRIHGEPTDEQISETRRKWKSQFGVEITDKEARRLLLSEYRAEDYRLYEENNDSFTGKLKNFFNLMGQLIKSVYSKNNQLKTLQAFRRLSRGYYAKQNPIEEHVRNWSGSQQVLPMEVSGLNQKEIQGILNSMMGFAIETGDPLSVINSLEDLEFDTAYFVEVLEEELAEAKEAGDYLKVEKLTLVIGNMGQFNEAFINYLSSISIYSQIIEQQSQEEQSEEVEESENSKGIEALKMHFETGGKSNATTNTKILLSFIPKFDSDGNIMIDPITGMDVLESPSYIWNTVETYLSGIVGYTNDSGVFVTPFEQMIEQLSYLASANKSFEILKDRLLQLTPAQQSQFFNAMSKANMEFLTTRFGQVVETFAGTTSTYMQYKYFNPHQRGKANRIFEKWVEDYSNSVLFTEKKGQLVPNIEAHKKAFNVWINDIAPRKASDVYDRESNSITSQGIKDIQKALKLFGLDVTEAGVRQVLHEINPVDQQAAYLTLKSKYLSPLFSATGRGGGKRFNIRTIALNKGIVNKKPVFVKSTDSNLNKNNTLFGERSVFMMFAAAEAMFENDYGSNTVRGPEGKMFWVYSLNNFLKKAAQQFKGSAREIQTRRETLWGRSSRWLKALEGSKNARNAFKIRVFNELRQEGGQDRGTTFKNLEPADEMLMRMNLLFANIDQQTPSGFFFPPTMADKGVGYILEGPELVLDNISYNAETGEFYFPDTILDIFGEYLVTELKRIRAVEKDLFGPDKLPDEKLIENYHYKGNKKNRKNANGLRFMLFPQLNTAELQAKLYELGLLDSKGKVFNTLPKDSHKLVREIIQDALKVQAFNQMESAKDSRIIIDNNGKLKAPGFDQKIKNYFRTLAIRNNSDTILNDAIGNMVGHYVVNTMIGNIETTMMFSGDPAYYKSMEDLAKRMPAIIAPGQDLDIRNEGDRWFNIAVSQDVIIESPEYEKYVKRFMKLLPNKTEKEVREMLHPYTEVNTTDAQAYITLERWKFLKQKLGQWEESRDNAAYERLKQGKATEGDIALAAQPLKGMYFSLDKGVPVYLKYSQAVLIPQAIEGTGLARVLEQMEAQNVDEHVFISGIKVGALSPTTFNLEANLFEESFDIIEGQFNVMTLDNNNWKLQQDLAPHKAERSLEGSQVKKNIIGNIKQGEVYKLPYGGTMTGEQIIRTLHNLNAELSNKGKNTLFKELGVEQIGNSYYIQDFTKISNMLIREFAKKEGTSDELLHSLKVGPDGKLIESLDDNIFGKQIRAMLSSLITKRTVKTQMLGGSFIQMSAFGMKKVKRFSNLNDEQKEGVTLLKNEELRAPYVTKDGTSRGQILLPHWMKDIIPGADRMTAAQIGKYLQDNRLLHAIGYRIPNQGMSSIDALEVVGFLPKTMGDTVVAYDEITAKTGSDFDIDKMYIMLPEFQRTAKGVKYVEYFNTAEEIYNDKYGKTQRYVAKVLESGRNYKTFNTTEEAFLKLQEKVSKFPTLAEFKTTNEGKSIDQMNSKAAINNKKLELYAAILLSENTFVELVSPLDQIGLKNNAAEVRALEAERKGLLTMEQINDIEAAQANPITYASTVIAILGMSQENLEWVSPQYQLFLKETFNGGKTGVGQQARHLVDHAISQWNYLNNPISYGITYLGIGNTAEIKDGLTITDLGAIYDVSGNLISNTISGRLDAYVDIAKDPYIFYLNNNGITSNVVAMLDRAGVDPNWTDFFVSQPSLKEYVKRKKLDLAKSVDPVFVQSGKNKGKIVSPEDQLREALMDVIKGLDADFKGYTKENIKEYIEQGDILDMLSLEDLKDGIAEGSTTLKAAKTQLLALELFLAWESPAMDLNMAVSASKADTKGAGKGIISSYKALKNQQDLDRKGTIYGFNTRFMETMLGTYTANSRDLFLELFAKDSLFMSQVFQEFLIELTEKQDVNLNEDMLESLESEFKAYMYGAIPGLSFDMDQHVFGDKTLAKKLQFFKLHNESTIKDNALIDYLSVNTRASFDYIQSQNTAKKSGFDKNTLTNAWRDLMTHPEARVQEFARDLARFSFAMSGFKNNVFTFHELMPKEMKAELGITDNLKDKKYTLNDALTYDMETLTSFIMRHNALNVKLVPSIPAKLADKKNKDIFGVRRSNKKNFPYLIRTKYGALVANKKEIAEDPTIAPVYKQYVTFEDVKAGNGVLLFKLRGYSQEGSAIYSFVERLGTNEAGMQLNEYTTQQSLTPIVSALPENNLNEEPGAVEAFALEEASKYVVTPKLDPTDTQEDNTDGPMAQLNDGVVGRLRELNKLMMELSSQTNWTFNVNFSKNEKAKLKKLGVSPELINHLVNETSANPRRFQGKSIAMIARMMHADYINQYENEIRGLELMSKEADKQLDDYLINYLEKYGVTIMPTTLKDIKQRYGIDAVGLTDSLNKLILIATEEQRRDTLPEEFGHMLVDLLGWRSDVVVDLRKQIQNWSGYKAIYDQYKNDSNYQLNGQPHDRKIMKEAIGQLIGRAIVMKWEGNKAETQNWFLQKALEIYDAVMSMLKNAKVVPAEILANEIATKVLEGNRDFIENYSEAAKYDFKPRTMEETLAGEDTANRLIDIISKAGGLLTGSLAVRAQGVLLRPDHEDLHDLDFKVDPKREEQLGADKIIENIKREIDKFSNFEVLYYTEDNGVLNATVTDIPGLHEKFAALSGNFTQRLDELTEFERNNMTLIDLFFGQEDTRMVDNNVHWSNVFHAKMSWGLGRSKDAYDFQNFVPFNKESKATPDMDGPFVMYKTRNSKVFDLVRDALELGTTTPKSIVKEGSDYFTVPGQLSKAILSIDTINTERFGGGKVISLDSIVGNEGVYQVVINPSNYRGSNVDLHGDYTKKKC